MKMHRLVIAIGMLLLVSGDAYCQVVSFGLPDYAELGNIKDRVFPALQELELAENGLSAGLDYVDVVTQAIGAAPVAGINNNVVAIAGLINAGNDIRNASGADSIKSLAGSFSPIDVSGIRSALTDFESQLDHLASQTTEVIQSPTIQLYYAVPVSNRAATDARSLLVRTSNGVDGFSSAASQFSSFKSLFGNYQQQVMLARQVAGEVGVAISDQMRAFPANPLNYPVLYPMLIDAISTEERLRQLGAEVAGISAKIATTETQIGLRSAEATDLQNSLEYALSAPALPSSWSTTGTGLSGPDARYEISFQGRTFEHPFTEIEGEFPLGVLTVTNLVSPDFTIGTTASQDIRFEAARTVNDPLLGAVTTIGTHDISMFYNVTANIDGDPIASMDFFTLPFLGVNIRIFEGNTFSVQVNGRYDSPLRVSSISAIRGERGGIIEVMVPEPSSLALVVCFVLLALRARYRVV